MNISFGNMTAELNVFDIGKQTQDDDDEGGKIYMIDNCLEGLDLLKLFTHLLIIVYLPICVYLFGTLDINFLATTHLSPSIQVNCHAPDF